MATAVGDTDAAPPRPKPSMAWKKLFGRVRKQKEFVPERRVNKVRSGDTKSPSPIGESFGASEAQQSSNPTSQNRLVPDTSRETLTVSTSGLRPSLTSEINPAQVVGQTRPSGSRPTGYSNTQRWIDETSLLSSSDSQQPTEAPDGK
jgi:hypothetical protein